MAKISLREGIFTPFARGEAILDGFNKKLNRLSNLLNCLQSHVIQGFMADYIRMKLFDALQTGLRGQPNLIQAVVGPRQVGKTTLALQVKERWRGLAFYHSADLTSAPSADWLVARWNECRAARKKNKTEPLLILDEVQKIPRWSEAVKKMADEDRIAGRHIRVVVLGSSSLLMQKGLNESLAGRFELHRHPHWSFAECREYFGLSLPEYLYFGGYPGALPLRGDALRWARYVRDSLIETVLGKDVLLMSPVSKPALLRQVFTLCLAHPAEIMSYQKMTGQLQDAGNTTTIASYIRLLTDAFLFVSLERFSGNRIRQRGSIPKIVVLDNALISVVQGVDFPEAVKDRTFWGRVTENAVGAMLANWLAERGGRLYYWRDRNEEVDYVAIWGNHLVAIEVKSGAPGKFPEGLRGFVKRFPQAQQVLIAPGASIHPGEGPCKKIELEHFLLNPESAFQKILK